MANDFEERIEKEILNNIEDPYTKDLTFITLTAKDCIKQVATSSVAAACFGACAGLLEVGDHASALLCYTGCSFFSGFVCYRGFRKTWQQVSIPVKSYILSFFKT